MRLPWPIDRRTVVNVTEFRSFTDRTRMLTQDEAMVDINLAVQYRRADPVKFAFNVRDPEETLGEVSESAIREIIGQSSLDFVLEKGRQEIGAKTKELIQRTIGAYNTGIEVLSVNLQDVSVPEQVAPAQKDAIKAREDKERATLSAQTYANDIVPKARGAAVSVVEGARAYRSRVIADADGETSRFLALAAEYQRAPAVTRERLYLETMEQVLGSASKILVDVEGTGNMIYLPLDKLLEQRSPQRSSADTPPTIRMEDGSEVDAEDPRAAEGALMNRTLFQVVIALLVLLWIASASMFQVNETELAIKSRLKKIIATDFEPGLHFMVPGLESVQKFDRRVLTRNYPAEQFLTSEGKILNVDFYVKWRISDVERYYLATNGDEESAASRLARDREGRPQGRHRQAHDPAGRRRRALRVHRRHPPVRRPLGEPARPHAGRRARQAHRPARGGVRVGLQPHAPELRAPGLAAARRGRRAGAADPCGGGARSAPRSSRWATATPK